MSENPHAWDHDALELHSIGALASVGSELDEITASVEALPDWRPARALLDQGAWLHNKLDELAQAWHTRLVVAIVGPSGAGKSTLLNALAGANLSTTGLTRPTTRQVVAYASDAAAAAPLRRALGDDDLLIETSPRAATLSYLTLLDTPDTNTLPENQALLARALELADIVLAVFAAQNPRPHDNLAFLHPFVDRLPRESIVPVLNMVDRVPPAELKEVESDFRRALETEWGLVPERVYLISAKGSVGGRAQFTPDETPINARNDYAALETLVYAALNRASQLADRRAAHAERLIALYRQEIAQALDATAAARRAAGEAIRGLEQRVQAALQQTVVETFAQVRTLDLSTAIYGLLAPRWWGPVGWLVGLWALLLRVASFVSRPGGRRPSFLGQSAPEMASDQVTATMAELRSSELEHLLANAWPPLADQLVAAGFATSIRTEGAWQRRLEEASGTLGVQVAGLYQRRLEGLADRLAAAPVQFLLNLPVLAMLVWIGADAVLAFVQRRALPATHLQTGGVALVALWVLGYVLLQLCVAVGLRRLRRAKGLGELGRGLTDTLVAPWAQQLQRLDALDDSLPR